MIVPTKKHEFVKEKLLEQITGLPPRTRVSSVKELMEQFSASQATVDKALQYLKDREYIEAITGKGIFTSQRRKSSHPLGFDGVDLIFFGKQDQFELPAFHNDLVTSFNKELALKGLWFRSAILPHRATVNEVISHIDRGHCEALVLVNLYNPDVYDAVRRRAIPFVLLFPNCPFEMTNSVFIDNAEIAKIWCDHLLELGHKRIAYISTESVYAIERDKLQRRTYFYEQLGQNGIVLDHDLILCPEKEGRDVASSVRSLFDRGIDFSAIICGDRVAGEVYKEVEHQGLVVGKDISVLGMDDCSFATNMKPALSTVRVSQEKLLELTVRKLKQSLKANDRITENQLVEPELIVRDSTAVKNAS